MNISTKDNALLMVILMFLMKLHQAKAIYKWVLCLVIISIYSAQTSAETAPLPPPELGETLTEYKTKQQLLEQAVTVSPEHEPQIKIYRKDKDGNIINDAVSYSSNGNVGNSGTNNNSAPRERVEENDYVYTLPNKQLFINKNASVRMNVIDSMNVAWPIARVDISNPSFKADVSSDKMSITISEVNKKASMANAKIYLQGQEFPLVFVLSHRDNMSSLTQVWNIQVSYKSPLNTSTEHKGLTNINITAKSRNSFRDVDYEKEQQKKHELERNSEEAELQNRIQREVELNQGSSIQNRENVIYSEEDFNQISDLLIEAVTEVEEELDKKLGSK